jgi:molybdopterin-guanine dinucleotide biosynthesis protein A
VVSLGDEILVTTNRPQAFAFLNAKLATDLLPGRGALGGLYTALNAATFPIVGVVACDMPFANPRLLAALRDRLVETGGAAVIPRNEKGLEPFHAVYQRSACLPFIKASLEADQRRVDSWFSQARSTKIGVFQCEHFPGPRARRALCSRTGFNLKKVSDLIFHSRLGFVAEDVLSYSARFSSRA